MKRLIGLLLVIVLMFSIAGCGAQEYGTNDEAPLENVSYNTSTAKSVGGLEFAESELEYGSPLAAPTERKVIKTGSVEIQTLEYEDSIQLLNAKIQSMGGYVESSNERGRDINNKYSTRSADFTIRIPKDKFETFLNDMMTVGTIVYKNTSGEDVTTQIFDNEARVKTLLIQEERLLDILSKAEKVEDIIVLESELSRVRYEIENLQGTLKRLNDLVALSTLHVSIYEVREIIEDEDVPETLGEKIADKFKRSTRALSRFFEGLVIWAIGSIPLLLIYLPIIIIIYIVVRIFRKRIKKSNEKRMALYARKEEEKK